MMLSDLRDYIAGLGIVDKVYQAKMPAGDRLIGVYNSRNSHAYETAIGGLDLESYGTKYVTFLIHWNKSPRDTEAAAAELFSALQQTREITINDTTIKFILPLVNEPVDVGTDDAGVYEMVIEAEVIFQKGGN